MSHAFSLIPNFSVPLAEPSARFHDEGVPFHADPILAAIDAHEEAYAVFQVATGDEASMAANDAYDAARTALLATPCSTRSGAFCLLRHLRWWLEQEVEFSADYQPTYGIAQAREADLTLLLGVDGIRRIPVALPLGRLVSCGHVGDVQTSPSAPTSQLIEAAPAPAPALIRLGRAASAIGEALTVIALVGGGAVLTGLATLV